MYSNVDYSVKLTDGKTGSWNTSSILHASLAVYPQQTPDGPNKTLIYSLQLGHHAELRPLYMQIHRWSSAAPKSEDLQALASTQSGYTFLMRRSAFAIQPQVL